MEKRLENLRNEMNDTLLKEAEFAITSKQAVLKTVRKNGKTANRISFWKQSINIGFTAVLFAGLLIFAVSHVQQGTPKMNTMSGDKASTEPNPSPSKETAFQDVKGKSKDSTNDVVNKKESRPPASYVVFDGYYYEKTGDAVEGNRLLDKIGEVKRIGDWKIVREGDSTEIPPGPLYSVKDMDSKEYIAGKGVIYEDGENKAGYLLFKRAIAVQKPDPSKIYNAKNDPVEVKLALENVRQSAGPFYELVEENVEPTFVSYSDQNGKSITLYYRLITRADQYVFITQYENKMKNMDYPASRFASDGRKDFNKPRLIDEYVIEGLKWAYYDDLNHGDHFYVSYGPEWTLEVSFQGELAEEQISTFLGNLNK